MIIFNGANVFSFWLGLNGTLAFLVAGKKSVIRNSSISVLREIYPDLTTYPKELCNAAEQHISLGLKIGKIFYVLFYFCIFLSITGVLGGSFMLIYGAINNTGEMKNELFVSLSIIYLLISPMLYYVFSKICEAIPDLVQETYSKLGDDKENIRIVIDLAASIPEFQRKMNGSTGK